MNKSTVPGSSSSLRQRQKADTVNLILDAVGRCLKDRSRGDMSLALVAREAGVGERTLYRYFPSKRSLLDAFWRAHLESVRGSHPADAGSLLEASLRIFPGFDANAEITYSLLTSPQGRAIAQSANKRRIASFKVAVREAVGVLPKAEFIRVCACIQALLSAGTWLQMREFWGLKGHESGKAVAEAIAVLVAAGRKKATRHKGEKLSD